METSIIFVNKSRFSLQTEYEIIVASEPLVSIFINNLIKGARHFRYFNKRPVSVIQNHLLTIMVTDSVGCPIGYGHLDKEDGIIWLGVAVADNLTGKGIGRMVMHYLIDFAKRTGETNIYLSVDADNYNAQKLYKSLGFEKIKELPDNMVFKFALK